MNSVLRLEQLELIYHRFLAGEISLDDAAAAVAKLLPLLEEEHGIWAITAGSNRPEASEETNLKMRALLDRVLEVLKKADDQ